MTGIVYLYFCQIEPDIDCSTYNIYDLAGVKSVCILLHEVEKLQLLAVTSINDLMTLKDKLMFPDTNSDKMPCSITQYK